MGKIAGFIIRSHKLIVFLTALLTVVCAATISRVHINYDLASYLSEDTLTRRTLDIIASEFTSSSQISFMLKDAKEGAAERYADIFTKLDGVTFVSYEEENSKAEKSGSVYRLITLTLSGEGSAGAVISQAKEILAGEYYTISGAPADMIALRENIEQQMPMVFLIAAAIVLGVLFLTSSAWIEPLIFIIVTAVSIVINLGTNWIFNSISFITFAVTALLQLALSMDYSILLLKNFERLRMQGLPDSQAVTEALFLSAAPITSSALTTVAGFTALMFMRFTIGYDIGLSLSKGILISMLTVFLLMPALLLMFAGALKRTARKPVMLPGSPLARVILRYRRTLPALLILVIVCGAILQTRNIYTFMETDRNGNSQAVADVFGDKNQLALIFPLAETDGDYAKQKELVSNLETMTYEGRKVVNSTYAMVTTGAQAVDYYTAANVAEMLGISKATAALFFSAMGYTGSARGDELLKNAELLLPGNASVMKLSAAFATANNAFNGERHSRILLDMDITYGGEAAYAIVTSIHTLLLEAYGEDVGMAGMTVSSYDISSAFNSDLTAVTFITIAAIILILTVTFRSLVVPVLLVSVIQGAIFINMALSVLLDEPVFFMCYLICLTIQMGATIDYAIVYTSNYRLFRVTFSKEEALTRSVSSSLPTVFTSGLIVVIAGFTIGFVSDVYYISSIGLLLGRGAIASVLLVLFLLPGLLFLLDRWTVSSKQKKQETNEKGARRMIREKQVVSLSSIERLHFIDDDGTGYLGFNQEWFGKPWQRMAGCGPTVAATLLFYLHKTYSLPLPADIGTRSGRRRYMESVWQCVTPGIGGVNKLDQFYNGILRYAEGIGIRLEHFAMEVPRRKESRPGFDDITRFITQGLQHNNPVAFLNLSNGKVENLDEWHWVTIVSLETDSGTLTTQATIIDAGKLMTVDLRAWYEKIRTGGGFVYIRYIKQ